MLRISISVICLLMALGQVYAQGYDPATTKTEDFNDWKLEQARNEYWHAIRTSGEEKDLAKIERIAYESMRNMENRAMFKTLASGAWIPIAGSQDGHNAGRIRCVSVDPNNPKVVYIAAASGGIWKTNDIEAAEVQWINLSDRLPTVNFGFIAIDPSNGDVIYAGTGESVGDNNFATQPDGAGIFKSTDAGMSWRNIADVSVAGKYCSQILIDNTDSRRIYVATGTSSIGILKTTDAGETWKAIKPGVNPLSITYNSKKPENLYVSGVGSIFRSVDTGNTWVKCTDGLPSGMGRTTIACAIKDSNVIYALIGRAEITLGVWVSTDFGEHWTKSMEYVSPGNSSSPDYGKDTGPTNVNPLGKQAFWCNSITVRPTDSRQIYVGGLDIYRSDADYGKKYTKLTSWNPSSYSSDYVHADIHHLAFFGTTLYACTDGGLARAAAPYNSWNTVLNVGVATLQFIGADADKDFTFVTGGCQDNGTNRATIIGSKEFEETRRGDGGRGWISPDNPSIAYTTYVYATFFKSLDSGHSFSGDNLIEKNADLTAEGAPFYPAYDVSSNGEIVAYGGNKFVWISTSGGDDGFAEYHSDKTISASKVIHVSQHDPSYMWAGDGTSLWRSSDIGVSWFNVPSGTFKAEVMGITSDPSNNNIVYAVTVGIGATNKHFYKSTDGGATFTSPATNFPDIPCYSVAFNKKDGKLFVGTEKGVVYSEDGGVTWNPLMNGMPYVMVTSLKVKGTNNDKLLAATYGRGLFWMDLNTLGVSSPSELAGLSIDAIRPNPVTDGEMAITFTQPASAQTQFTLFDILGREVKVLDKSYYGAGTQTVRVRTTGMAAGTYVVTMVCQGKAISRKIVME